MTRRDFLRAGGFGAVGLTLNHLPAAHGLWHGQETMPQQGVNCILLFLVGGPSQLDTWDLKPGAPSDVRGPFRPIRTNVPGIEICEHFPLMARMADRFAIVRSVHHEEAAIHETGQQLMQTGRLGSAGMEFPHCGSVMSYLEGDTTRGLPANVLLPRPMGDTGAALGHGQGAGFLGQPHEPVSLRAEPHFQYCSSRFGQSCLLARRLVERGVRMVTVNMFDTIFNTVTWDCHADGGLLNSSLDDYRESLCPMFDMAYSALLEDLHQRGLLEKTLVLAMGEFGRTPRINPRGGRDHWPGVWSILFAGGGIKGGQVIGSSDRLGAEPRDRPVRPAEVVATIYRALGVDPATQLLTADGRSFPLVDAAPVEELF